MQKPKPSCFVLYFNADERAWSEFDVPHKILKEKYAIFFWKNLRNNLFVDIKKEILVMRYMLSCGKSMPIVPDPIIQ